MDRKSFLAIILIMTVLVIYQYYVQVTTPAPAPQSDSLTTIVADSALDQPVKQVITDPVIQPIVAPKQAAKTPADTAKLAPERLIEVETDLYKAVISNRNGVQFKSWLLKGYKTKDTLNYNMVQNNGFSVELNDWNGNLVTLADYVFTLSKDTTINEKRQLLFKAPFQDGFIQQLFVFTPGSFEYQWRIAFTGITRNFSGHYYSIHWKNGLPLAEKQFSEDDYYASSLIYIGDEMEIYNDPDDQATAVTGTNIRWAATRIKYFTAALVPESAKQVKSVTLTGRNEIIGEDTEYKRFNFGIDIHHPQANSEDVFRVYMGPLDYDILSQYEEGLDEMVLGSSGYERFFRPFSLILLSVLKTLHDFIPNYGLVIILFSILLKLVLFPLTRSSYKSMSAMKELKPKMDEINERYKNDAAMKQKKIMEMYKENKISPLGGCLPMLLQMPVLFAMYILFRSTVQLRGEPFFAWITDLSQPDTLFTLPFSLPFYGNEFNILPFLMALSMFFQQRQTIQDQSQKMLMYFMPVFLFFVFNSFPSGLNLYYTVFNVLTIAQQKFTPTSVPQAVEEKPKNRKLAIEKKRKK
jgi:YidC/Oxa1 family membrane protein insertase